jgi:hypothetical protein
MSLSKSIAPPSCEEKFSSCTHFEVYDCAGKALQEEDISKL